MHWLGRIVKTGTANGYEDVWVRDPDPEYVAETIEDMVRAELCYDNINIDTFRNELRLWPRDCDFQFEVASNLFVDIVLDKGEC